jgi:hemerythrin-like domain-containing protein
MHGEDSYTRRRFLWGTAAAGGGVLAGALSLTGAAPADETDEKGENEVTPAEDLMFEHGVIERMLLIYEEAARRILSDRDVPADAIAETARLTRRFTEDYHEKNEEQHVFPLFENNGPLADLVKTLKRQHTAGRQATDFIMQHSQNGSLAEPKQLAAVMLSFSRMYVPHAARENSVLFKAFQSIMPAEQYRELGEQFEDKEHEIFGEDGFERMVDRVSAIERKLNIHNLDRFTVHT